MKYKEAQQEIEKILKDIENGNIDIDKLTEKVKKACELIKFCNTKLTSTENEINEIFKQFDNENK